MLFIYLGSQLVYFLCLLPFEIWIFIKKIVGTRFLLSYYELHAVSFCTGHLLLLCLKLGSTPSNFILAIFPFLRISPFVFIFLSIFMVF